MCMYVQDRRGWGGWMGEGRRQGRRKRSVRARESVRGFGTASHDGIFQNAKTNIANPRFSSHEKGWEIISTMTGNALPFLPLSLTPRRASTTLWYLSSLSRYFRLCLLSLPYPILGYITGLVLRSTTLFAFMYVVGVYVYIMSYIHIYIHIHTHTGRRSIPCSSLTATGIYIATTIHGTPPLIGLPAS